MEILIIYIKYAIAIFTAISLAGGFLYGISKISYKLFTKDAISETFIDRKEHENKLKDYLVTVDAWNKFTSKQDLDDKCKVCDETKKVNELDLIHIKDSIKRIEHNNQYLTEKIDSIYHILLKKNV